MVVSDGFCDVFKFALFFFLTVGAVGDQVKAPASSQAKSYPKDWGTSNSSGAT